MVSVVHPTVDDLYVRQFDINAVLSLLRQKRSYGALAIYGKDMELPNSVKDVEQLSPSMFKYIKAAQKHAQHVVDNVSVLLVKPLLEAAISQKSYSVEVSVKHAGIKSLWGIGNLDGLLVNKDWVTNSLERVGTEVDRYGRSVFKLLDFYSRPNPNDSLLIDAYNQARKNLINAQLGNLSWSADSHYYAAVSAYGNHEYYHMHDIIQVLAVDASVADVRPTVQDVMRIRSHIVEEREREARGADEARTQVSMENFQKYWDSLKQRNRALVVDSEVRDSFEGIPLLAEGTRSSRTWGIEIETVQAQLTTRPRGWDKRGDGSLESMCEGDCTYDYCNCDCDQCGEDDHGNCYISEDEDTCAEFVSPILNHFNSDGLRQLTRDIGDAPCNDSPGIHVHVGGDDLSPSDIARLVRLYSIVSPFLWPLTNRNTFGYCKDVSPRNIAHWLSIDRNIRKNSETLSVRDAVYAQPDDRYHDLNTQAMNAHGTIEFRAMGAVYNYKHLVRWAWLCRELVNVSKLDLSDDLWRKVSSFGDVLNIIYQYGSEISESMISPTFDVNDLSLEVEFAEESDND